MPYTDAWAIRPGDPITARVTDPEITVHLHNMAFNGKLEFVKFSVETVRRVVAVSGLIEDLDGQLKDGMAVELSIYPGTARQ